MNRKLFSLFFVCLMLVVAVSSAAAAPSSPATWFVNYWDNTEMKGAPVATSSTGLLEYDWGSGAPHAGVPADKWSAQWTTYKELPAGTYRFTVTNDDGVRVYFGDKHIITDWNKHPARTSTALVSLTGGRYPIAVDFFDETGKAVLKFGWERVSEAAPGAADVTILSSGTATTPAPTPVPANQAAWYASYWNNRSQEGSPAVTRYESAINNDWGTNAPVAGINADNWSARWTSYVTFPAGTYRFTTVSDDGLRLYVNDRYLIDQWNDHNVRTDTATVTLPAGTYPVAVDYYDHGGNAVAKVWWEQVGGPTTGGVTPLPAGSPSATPTVNLRMRFGPDTSYLILDVIPRGTPVAVIGRSVNNNWLQVQYKGETGWIFADLATFQGNLNNLPVVPAP